MTAQSLPSAAAAARNDAVKREAVALRRRQVLAVASAVMRYDGYDFPADLVAASNNPKCVRWRETAEAMVAAYEACK